MNFTAFEYFKNINDFSNDLLKILDNYLFNYDTINMYIDTHRKGVIIENLRKIMEKDILALIKGDPAARINKEFIEGLVVDEDINYVLKTYRSLRAVMMYRVAHLIQEFGDVYLKEEGCEKEAINGANSFLHIQARDISDEAKAFSGLEIHPAAKIGFPFVVDHGYNTVIGETCEIGNGCFILQGVILGSREVNKEKITTINGRRQDRKSVV